MWKARYVGAACPVAMLILYVVPYHLRRSVAFGPGMLAAFFVFCWMDRQNYEQKVFLMAVFFTLCRLACAIAEIL